MPEAVSNLPEWPQHELLAHEKALLGFYVTGHPLTPYVPILEKYTLANTVDLKCPLCRGSVKDTVLLTCTIKPEDYLLIIEDGIFD